MEISGRTYLQCLISDPRAGVREGRGCDAPTSGSGSVSLQAATRGRARTSSVRHGVLTGRKAEAFPGMSCILAETLSSVPDV